MKDVTGPEKIVSDPEAFPGPASTAALDKLKEYVRAREDSGGEGVGADAAEGERLLWSIAGLSLQFKVCAAGGRVIGCTYRALFCY